VTTDLKAKAQAFHDLHRQPGCFVMPNAWDAGSARLLVAAGFPALGTTSAGIAFSRGLPDYEDRIPRAAMLEACAAIAAAVGVPVSGDLEAGYGATPGQVAETMSLAIEAGLAGGSLEDHLVGGANELYDIEAAAERVAAARDAIDASGLPFVLTARAECYLTPSPSPCAGSTATGRPGPTAFTRRARRLRRRSAGWCARSTAR
jgi:2-methylisocitrate lyase-like PEP mutase family enzyme